MTSISLADALEHHADIRLICLRCNRTGVVDGADMLTRLGPDFPVRSIGRRCVCSGCGSRENESRPEYPGRPVEPISRG